VIHSILPETPVVRLVDHDEYAVEHERVLLPPVVAAVRLLRLPALSLLWSCGREGHEVRAQVLRLGRFVRLPFVGDGLLVKITLLCTWLCQRCIGQFLRRGGVSRMVLGKLTEVIAARGHINIR
jgi:hypothetical protein